MSANRLTFAAVVSIAIPALAAPPPYSAPVIHMAEFAIRNREIEVTLKGTFHAGAKTVVASCEPFFKGRTFDPRQVQIIRRARETDDDVAPRGAGMADAVKIVLDPFLTGPDGVDCVFTLRDEEPSSKPASQRTSAPFRTRVTPDKLPGIQDAIAAEMLSNGQNVCLDKDDRIGQDGLPVDPAVLVVVGDVIYANVNSPVRQYHGNGLETSWYPKEGLYASDFDIFAISSGGERRKLTVDVDDFSREKAPLSLGLLIDESGSMRGALSNREQAASEDWTKRSLAEAAGKHVVSEALKVGMRRIPPKDPGGDWTFQPLSNAFVMNFNEEFQIDGGADLGADANHFVQDPTRLASWITGTAGSGIVLRYGTRLLDAVYRAAYEMDRVASRENCHPDSRVVEMRKEMEERRIAEGRDYYTYAENYALKRLLAEVSAVKRRRVLFVESDGNDNRSRLKLDQVIEYLTKSGIVVYGINFVKDSEEAAASVLPDLAWATGGQALLINLSLSAKSIEEEVNQFTSTVLHSLETEYEFTFKESLDSCSMLEMRAYDTSQLAEAWHGMETIYKRQTCQLEASGRTSKPEPKSEDVGLRVTGGDQEKRACVRDRNASLVPWEQYYYSHYRDKDIPELQVTHRAYVGPCSPSEIRAYAGGGKGAIPATRQKGKQP